MQKLFFKVKKFVIDILFPKFCLNCGKEGSYLCEDCFSLIDVSERQYCPFCSIPKIVLDGRTCPSCRRSKKLNGLYSAVPYNNSIIKKLIYQFKYSHIKELAKPLSSLITIHLANLNPVRDSENVDKSKKENISNGASKVKNFSGFVLMPIPLHKKKLKERGFNQAEEIAKQLSKTLGAPVLSNILVKIKQTLNQVDLKKEEREKNIKGSFSCQKPDLIFGKKILLVDDVFTTGSTMEEGALTLKRAGAKQVWGIVVARG